jgi:hypothetical protein
MEISFLASPMTAFYFTVDRVGGEQGAVAVLSDANIPRLMQVNAFGTAPRTWKWFKARPTTVLAHVQQAMHDAPWQLSHAGAL